MSRSSNSSRRSRRSSRVRRSLCIESLEDRQLLAVDLEPLSIGQFGLDSTPQLLTAVDDQVFFVATHGRTQIGLWVTDGSEEGTRQVVPDEELPTNPRFKSLTNFDARLFFSLADNQLYVSDGTTEGTELLKTFDFIGSQNESRDFVAGADGVYFIARQEETTGDQLWKSDGTPSGTVSIAVVATNDTNAELGNVTSVGNAVYFTSMDPSGRYDLWRVDGAAEDATLITPLAPGQLPAHFIGVGETLYFSVTEQTGEGSLWRAENSQAGAEMVAQIRLMQEESTPPPAAPRFNLTTANVGGVLYFAGTDGDSGYEVWRSDGTEEGTVLVKDLWDGAESSRPIELTNVGGVLYFTAEDGVNGRQLWKSDGTSDGTVAIEQPGLTDVPPRYLHNVNGLLYFTAADATSGLELWVSDGTNDGTRMVKDIQAGAANGVRGSLVSVGDVVYFAGNDGAHGDELWRSTGTDGGTTLVKDIVAGSYGTGALQMANVNGLIYFGASDGVHGHELWRTDGTTAGTSMLKDINPKPVTGSAPTNFVNVAGTLFFSAADDNALGLWKSDGTEEGTVLVRQFPSAPNGSLTSFMNLNGTLYFALSQASATELWRSDGTEDGTVQIASEFTLGSIVAAGDTVYLSMFDPSHGWELGKLTSGSDVPVLVKDIRPGESGSQPRELTNVNGTVFFVADDGQGGNELWKTDGTEASTVQVRDLGPGATGSDPRLLTNVNGILYFVAQIDFASDPPLEAIARSDGSEAGTMLAIPLNVAGTAQESVTKMVNVDGVLYFATTTTDEGNATLAIYRSDGDSKAPLLLKSFDIPSEQGPHIFQHIAGLLYFSAPDDAGTLRLWRSDGTIDGTVLVDTTGNVPEVPLAIVPLYQRLFVTGLNETVRPALDLWVGDAGWQNLGLRADVNGDGVISPHDALLIINELTFNDYRDPVTGELPPQLTDPVPPHDQTPLFDVTGDGIVSPHDALFVINLLGSEPTEDEEGKIP